MRLFTLLFPWFALRRIRLLTEHAKGVPADQWENGYFRALWEIRVLLHEVPPAPPEVSPLRKGTA